VLNIRLRTLIALAIAALVLLVLAPTLVTLYTDWLWFGEVGYEEVFLRTLAAETTLGGIVLVVAFAVLYLNVRLAQITGNQPRFTIMTPQGPHTIAIPPRRVKSLLYVAAGAAARIPNRQMAFTSHDRFLSPADTA